MEITNQVREYTEKGMAEMSEKFEAEGGKGTDFSAMFPRFEKRRRE